MSTHLQPASCIEYFQNIIYEIEWRKNGFEESKESILAGWCMRALQKEKGITCESF
jgi:hypothetical protein